MRLIIYSLTILTSLGLLAKQPKWKQVKNENGITVSNRVRNDGLQEFKAITYVKSVKLSSLMAVMDDVPNYKNWMESIVSSHLVKKINSQERIVYVHFGTPWPVSDRDNVSYSKVSQNKKDKSITIRMRSRPFEYPKKKGIVRVKKGGGYFWFKPLKNKVTMIIYQRFTDPGGSVPKWLLRMAGSKVPYQTLRKLRIMVKKLKYKNKKYSQINEPW